MAGIFVASSIQNPPAPPSIVTDKELHGAMYLVLGATLVRALARAKWRRVTLVVVAAAVAIATAYGATDEFHQRFVPGRTPDVADLIADAIGAAIAAVGAWAWGILNRRYEL